MKILIIDDNRIYASNLQLHLMNYLNLDFDDILIKTNPKNGLAVMDHSYDIVFIDYQFDQCSITGKDICIKIKSKYPLAVRILSSAYARDHMANVISAGFDAYLDKDIGELDKDMKYISGVIEEGFKNSREYFKSEFSEIELKSVKTLLDTLELVLDNGWYKKLEHVFIVARLLSNEKKSCDEQQIIEHLSIIIDSINKGDKRVILGKEYFPLVRRTAFNQYFNKSSYIETENALKARQLFKENPERWSRVKQLSVIDKLLLEFQLC